MNFVEKAGRHRRVHLSKEKLSRGRGFGRPFDLPQSPLYPETQTILLIFHSTIRLKVQYGDSLGPKVFPHPDHIAVFTLHNYFNLGKLSHPLAKN